MKIYPILSSDLYALSCVPVSMLDRVGDDELRAHLSAGGSLKFLVAQDTFGRVQTDTGYVSKHIEYADLSTVFAEQFEVPWLQAEVRQLSDFVRKNDLQNVSVVIDSLPSPYIVSAFHLSNGYLTELSGYALSSALTSVVPKLRYAVISADAIYASRLSSPEIDGISALFPAEASESNKLADKEYVSAEIQLNTASFRGVFEKWADVPDDSSGYRTDAYGKTIPTYNDYIVISSVIDYSDGGGDWGDVPENEREGQWRFGYLGIWNNDHREGWRPQYRIEKYNFTAGELNAIRSGVTFDNFVKRPGGSVGNDYKGVWLEHDGTVKTMQYELHKNVPAEAKLTDHVYTALENGGIKVDPPKNDGDTYKLSVSFATKSTIGGIKVGTGLNMSNGALDLSATIRAVTIQSYSQLSSPEQLSADLFGDDIHVGAIMIIKRGYYLADSRQYTGYVYTGTGWEAMGGNYSADNVILPEDIQLAGEWLSVGNIVHDEENDHTMLYCGGKSVTETFRMIFGSAPQKKVVHAPQVYQQEFQYDGEMHGPLLDYPDEKDLLVVESGRVQAIDKGEYTYTLSLPDTDKYVWSTGGSDPITISWRIV